MKVIEKNVGPKIDYSVNGTKLNLNDELILDLAKYERDFDVNLDICENEFNMLVIGLGRRYVAQIHIPARQYVEVEIENGDGPEGEGESIRLEPVPFSMDNVTLTLWEIGGIQ